MDVSQEVIIREEDCGTHDGILVSEIVENGQVIETFGERLKGRYPVEDILDPKTGEVLIDPPHHDDRRRRQVPGGPRHPRGYDPLRPHLRGPQRRVLQVLRHQPGIGEPVGEGEAVGIIAAQSIGEPGTQLTMRTFHTGGVAGGDITQGLPRVEELFEARRPKEDGH